MSYHLYISPCPNDTFIFEALVSGKIFGFPKGAIEVHLHDIAVLNEYALKNQADIIKVSYGMMGQLFRVYQLLSVGSALGRGVGPLLVGREESFAYGGRLLVPGRFTTANLLFDLYAAQHFLDKGMHIEKQYVLFSEVVPMLHSGIADMGLLIHEGRFTYAKQGVYKIADLGDFWEKTYRLPIPLGGIMVRRSLAMNEKLHIKEGIKKSLQHAQERLPLLGNFVKINAQEMEEKVVRAHIDLYVNDYTVHLDTIAQKAIQVLLQHTLPFSLPEDWLI